jgi:hypothetical protein
LSAGNIDLNAQAAGHFLSRTSLAMKYYVWMDAEDRPLSKAWPYEDETERMAAERHPSCATAVLRAGTREQLTEYFGLQEVDFADSKTQPSTLNIIKRDKHY